MQNYRDFRVLTVTCESNEYRKKAIVVDDKLTKGDVEKIEQEIEHRKLVVRKEAIAAVQEARAQGDLSENFEYYAAKRDKNANESRIRYLERMLKTATIISAESGEDEVGVNNTVTIYIPEDDVEETYRLVTAIRGNTLNNQISIDSPLGRALLHAHLGDRITVKVNDGYSYEAEVREIRNTQNEENDQIREF